MDGGIAKLHSALQYGTAAGIDPHVLRLCIVGAQAAQAGQPQASAALDFGHHAAEGIGVGCQQQTVIVVFASQIHQNAAFGSDPGRKAQRRKRVCDPTGGLIGKACGGINGQQGSRLLPCKIRVIPIQHSN